MKALTLTLASIVTLIGLAGAAQAKWTGYTDNLGFRRWHDSRGNSFVCSTDNLGFRRCN